MPLYEYECRRCHGRFERIQKFSDPPLRKCPSCRGSVRKLISAPGIQFKGSGWYITDYARKGASDHGSGKGSKKSGDGAAAEGAVKGGKAEGGESPAKGGKKGE